MTPNTDKNNKKNNAIHCKTHWDYPLTIQVCTSFCQVGYDMLISNPSYITQRLRYSSRKKLQNHMKMQHKSINSIDKFSPSVLSISKIRNTRRRTQDGAKYWFPSEAQSSVPDVTSLIWEVMTKHEKILSLQSFANHILFPKSHFQKPL